MDSKKILDKTRLIVANTLGLEVGLEESQVGPDSNFSADLKAEAMDLKLLVVALENGFGIDIPYDKAIGISSVSDAANYIQAQLENKHGEKDVW